VSLLAVGVLGLVSDSHELSVADATRLSAESALASWAWVSSTPGHADSRSSRRVRARRIAWVGRAGEPLVRISAGRWRCPRTGEFYEEQDDALVPVIS